MLRRYLIGSIVARTGDEMSGPALLVLGLAVTGSPSAASALLAGLTVSAAAGGPLLGVLLDRSRRPGRLLAAALAGYAGGLLVVLVALGTAPLPALVAITVLTGLLGPAISGGWTSQLPLTVPPAKLPTANALDALTYNAAALAGPALTGILATLTGAPVAAAASLALVASALPAAWTLPTRPGTPAGQPTASPSSSHHHPVPAHATPPSPPGDTRSSADEATTVWGDLMAGFAVLASPGALRRATATSMLSFAGLAMLVVPAPLLGTTLLGEPGLGALLLSVLAASALLANAALTRLQSRAVRPRSPDGMLFASVLVMAAGMATAGFAGSFAPLVAAVTLVGAGEGPQLTALFAVRHREAPPALRSHIFTTGASLKITSFAAGAALAGPLTSHSPATAVLTGALLQLLAAATFITLSPRPHGAT